jgi:hypothetical protein
MSDSALNKKRIDSFFIKKALDLKLRGYLIHFFHHPPP